MNNILYLWDWIGGSNYPLTKETRTPFQFLFVLDLLNKLVMKEIKLTQGKVVLVDDEDYEYLNQWKWHVSKSPNTFYARRNHPTFNGKRGAIMLHRVIMNPPLGTEIDHIDRNGLNCQKANLRNVTHQQNCMNRRPRNGNKYKGVCLPNGTIYAKIHVNGMQIHLGTCQTELQAAKRYDAAAKYFKDEFAYLNFK